VHIDTSTSKLEEVVQNDVRNGIEAHFSMYENECRIRFEHHLKTKTVKLMKALWK